jgi:hypothetical protein
VKEYTDRERIDALERWGLAYAQPGACAENTVEVERFDECQDEECDGVDCQCPEQEWTIIGPQESGGVWRHGNGTTLRDAIDEGLTIEAELKERRARFAEKAGPDSTPSARADR